MKINPELDKQAKEIIDWSRRKLALKLPEFLPAIYLLPLRCDDKPLSLHTDGEFLYYNPTMVVEDYLKRKDSIASQIMHITAHGLLGHISKRQGQQEQLFDAAADIKATSFVEQLPIPLTPRWDPETRQHLHEWDEMTLEKAYLTPETREEAAEFIAKSAPLTVDDHFAWMPPQPKGGNGGSGMDQWAAAARQIAAALVQSGNGQMYGNLAGEMCEEYRDVEESGVSYKEFLRKFCSLRERQETDPNSMSSIWYQLGLSLTGDAPFIEPEELREDAPTLDLAVALDTSGSCCGDIMKGFLEELTAILRDAGGPKVELTLIQCDAEIQSVQTLTREDTADGVLDSFNVMGFGGTDFRPVFDYINEQQSQPDGKTFRGLLYLSDGYGEFPAEEPDYPVAFLFPKDECDWDCGWSPIPDWVTQVRIADDNRLIIGSDTKNN